MNITALTPASSLFSISEAAANPSLPGAVEALGVIFYVLLIGGIVFLWIKAFIALGRATSLTSGQRLAAILLLLFFPIVGALAVLILLPRYTHSSAGTNSSAGQTRRHQHS